MGVSQPGGTMSSDVTISAAGYSFQFTSTELLLSCVFIVALVIILLIAFSYTRRAALRSAEAADVLIVQMERIGDSLERLVAQNAHNALMAQSAPAGASAPAQRPDYPPSPQRPAADWAAVERVAKESAPPTRPTSRPPAPETKHVPAAQQAAAPASSTPPAKSPKPGAE